MVVGSTKKPNKRFTATNGNILEVVNEFDDSDKGLFVHIFNNNGKCLLYPVRLHLVNFLRKNL